MDNQIEIFDGSTLDIKKAREIHVYSEVCALMEVDLEDITVPMIFWQDTGTIFCPKDWQSLPPEFAPDDVETVDWVELQTGSPAVLYDGLPRIAPFMGRPRKNPVKRDAEGREFFEAVVKAQGTTGRLYPPKDWIGHTVRVIRLD